MEQIQALLGADMLAALQSGFAEHSATVDVDGNRVAYRAGGSRGPVVVLLHGISSGAASWLPCASLLAAQARVVAWDAPGYGNSSPLPQAQPKASDYAARLEELMRALGVRPDVIVGHSLGALMAAAYVSQAAPELMPRRLLLVSPAQGYGGPGREEKSREVETQRLDALATLGVDGLAERGPRRLLAPDSTPGAQAWVRWNMARLREAGYRQAVSMLCRDDIAAYLSRRPAEVPAAVACGAQDVVTTPLASRDLADRFSLPFSLLPDAGHVCYVDRPTGAAALVRDALGL